MLRTNLSTRPFYNLRAVQAALGAAIAIVLAFTFVNVAQIVRLTISQQSLGASAADAEDEAARLRLEAAGIRAQINPQELQVVANAAREANRIIDQRAFSWTELLSRFESTLPPDVRITAIQPRLESDGDFVVAVGVQARRAEDLDAFVEALEDVGAFHDVLAVTERTDEDGLIQSVVEGAYVAPVQEAVPDTPAPATEGGR